MSANVNSAGEVRQLDKRPEPDENITEKAVADPKLLTKFLLRLFREVSRLKRLWRPRRIDYEDTAVDATGTTLYRFSHNFAGRVRWLVVDWEGAAAYDLSKDATTTDDVLVLISRSAGTATIRVEEAG